MIRPLTVLAPLLVAVPFHGPQAIRYAPAADTTLTRVFQLVTELDMEGMRTVMNGQEIPAEYLPEMEIHVLSASTFAVTDRIVQVADGRPLELRRTFDSVASQTSEELSLQGEDTNSMETASSPYEGREIRFTWNEDDEEYEAVFADDDEVIDGLWEDMDLRGFLPEEEVEEDDTWELAPDVFAALLSPGGDLALQWEGDDLQGGDHADDELTGKVEARFAGIQDDGLALIEITGEVETQSKEAGDLEHIPVADGTATITSSTTFELDGRLYWKLEAGHLDSLELDAKMKVDHLTEKDPDQPGGDFAATVILTGTWECRISVKDA